jgi:hypothetical protein
MTAAGVASLFLLGNDLYSQTEKCGIYVENDRIAKGLEWLSRMWSVSMNPGAKGGLAEPYYYLYAVERIGVLTGLKYIGSHDWYREGAAFLVRDQKPDGSWGRRLYGLSDTCFAVLFLAKGPAPILLSKLRWEGKGLIHRMDARHWAEACEPILRQRLSYQILDKKAPVSEYLKAPLLFINGHTAPTFTPEERESVRTFLRQGGILVAEACCSSPEFDRGFRQEMLALYPDKRIVPLPSSHPIYTIRHQIRDSKEMFLQGFTGCRTSVFYSPRGFTCAVDLGGNPNDIGFRIAVNAALYATGNQRLSDERQLEVKIEKETAKPVDAVQRGAFQMAQIKHDGDWNPDASVVPNILQHLKDNTRLRVSFARDAVTFSHAGLFDYSALFVTGHATFTWTKDDAANLRGYLKKGGFLLAESCCGQLGVRPVVPRVPPRRVPGQQARGAAARSPGLHLRPRPPRDPVPRDRAEGESRPDRTVAGGSHRRRNNGRLLLEVRAGLFDRGPSVRRVPRIYEGGSLRSRDAGAPGRADRIRRRL